MYFLPFALLLTLIFAFSSCATGREAGSAEGKSLEMEPFLLGGIRPERVPVGWQVFTNARAWEQFWSQHSSTAAPQIDFRHFTLVAVFLGRKPNPGYAVKIISVREFSDKVVVEALESRPSPELLYAQVIVYPYDAVLIPNVGKEIRVELMPENESE